MKKVLYVDMDNVLADFASGIARLPESQVLEYQGRLDEAPGIFSLMVPVAGAVESFVALAERFDAYPLLDAINDAIVTGPTGTNVRDLRILLAY